MHCPTCNRAMLSTSSQEIKDDQGAMTITRWRCKPCHETAEEIWLSAGYRGSSPISIRYAVATPQRQQSPTRSFNVAKKGSLAYAGVC